MRSSLLLAFGVLTAAACGQSFTTTLPGTFIDISTMGGTVVTGVGDDTEHNIVTTIGNVLFPAGDVRIGNNGVAVAGITSGDVSFINQPIPAASLPSGLPAGGAGYLCPFWDDLFPTAGSAQTIWFKEDMGVLIIQWKNETHFDFQSAAQTITFEIQVRASAGPCEPLIQFLYSDAEFGGTGASND